MPESAFEELGTDEEDVAELLMACEEFFDIEFPYDAIETMTTVGDVVRFVDDNR
ncbi:MAG: phosphopantetheine-binding protein [Oscillospiraceae bacterium]|nr:phosphopantetheine-binding protein [Oscillospiraceae bacterium]